MNLQSLFDPDIKLDDDIEEKIRNWLRETKRWDQSNTITPKSVTNETNDRAYMLYQLLSIDAHPTTHTLARHLNVDASGIAEFTVEPKATVEELAETAMLLAMNVLGVLVGVNELLGNASSPPAELSAASDDYIILAEKWKTLG